ncbi:unnamed protein product [Acanthosepion pharaonis]|uniref:Uncharacterized protein n=1 Tax=Acanthosepion pharaonis TaxID=158019 RepID=A0A812DKF4_ACAPH|nr:unnamed protein product [Sepia pharaonis]
MLKISEINFLKGNSILWYKVIYLSIYLSMYLSICERREQPTEPSMTTLLSLQRVRSCSTGLLGKRVRGQGAVATLAPSRSVNAALPVVNCGSMLDMEQSTNRDSDDSGLLWCRDCVSPLRRRKSCQGRRFGGTSKALRLRPATWDRCDPSVRRHDNHASRKCGTG